MSNLNDIKKAALETLTGNTGSIDDLETEWLLSVVVAPNGEHINDLWKQYILEQGFDDASSWLASLGYTTGGINNQWRDYWEALGPAELFDFQVELGSIVTYQVDTSSTFNFKVN